MFSINNEIISIMVKQVKLVAIIEANENAVFDDSSINRSVGLLGSVKSFEVWLELEQSSSNEQKSDKTSAQTSSELVNFIRESHKIYFGTLTMEQRKSVGISVLHAANLEKIRSDEAFKSKFTSICSQKFSIDESSVSNILSNTNDDNLFNDIRSKFLEGDLIKEDLLKDKKFNLVTAFRFFPNAEEDLRKAVLDNIVPHIENNGLLVFNNHRNKDSFLERLIRLVFRKHYRGLNLGEVKVLIEDYNLQLIKIYSMGLFRDCFCVHIQFYISPLQFEADSFFSCVHHCCFRLFVC